MTDGREAMQNQIRSDKPTPARMYDYYLDGKDNFAVDRAAVDSMRPEVTQLLKKAAWENRRFMWRAVDYLARECGIAQFIDVGSGLPAVRSTHEVVQEVNPDARVVYVDNDPIVLSHGQALLAKNGNTAIVSADVRDPASVIDAPGTQRLIDFEKPVALLFVALFHFILAPGHPQHVPGELSPAQILTAFRERVVPGSCVVITHGTFEGVTPEDKALIEGVYKGSTSAGVFRSHEEITALFEGWRVVPPGVVDPWAWPVEDTVSPRSSILWGGVGVKDGESGRRD
jgi:hypothetical protein